MSRTTRQARVDQATTAFTRRAPRKSIELRRLCIIRPELFETILSRMQQALEAPQTVANPRIVLHRCLMYYFDAAATLSSNRMQTGKAVMGEVSRSLLLQSSESLRYLAARDVGRD